MACLLGALVIPDRILEETPRWVFGLKSHYTLAQGEDGKHTP